MTTPEPSDAERATWPQATADYIAALEADNAAERERAEKAEAALEIERMRLSACGVAALANTRGAYAKAVEGLHPDYDSASLQDVRRAVMREIEQRERAEKAERERDDMRAMLDRIGATVSDYFDATEGECIADGVDAMKDEIVASIGRVSDTEEMLAKAYELLNAAKLERDKARAALAYVRRIADDAYAMFVITQNPDDYPADHWSRRLRALTKASPAAPQSPGLSNDEKAEV